MKCINVTERNRAEVTAAAAKQASGPQISQSIQLNLSRAVRTLSFKQQTDAAGACTATANVNLLGNTKDYHELVQNSLSANFLYFFSISIMVEQGPNGGFWSAEDEHAQNYLTQLVLHTGDLKKKKKKKLNKRKLFSGWASVAVIHFPKQQRRKITHHWNFNTNIQGMRERWLTSTPCISANLQQRGFVWIKGPQTNYKYMIMRRPSRVSLSAEAQW